MFSQNELEQFKILGTAKSTDPIKDRILMLVKSPISADDIAALLGCSTRAVYRNLKSAGIKSIKGKYCDSYKTNK